MSKPSCVAAFDALPSWVRRGQTQPLGGPMRPAAHVPFPAQGASVAVAHVEQSAPLASGAADAGAGACDGTGGAQRR